MKSSTDSRRDAESAINDPRRTDAEAVALATLYVGDVIRELLTELRKI